VSIAATAFLMAFYALEAPSLLEAGDLDQPTPLGHTNDVLIAVTLILLLPVVSFAARAGGWTTAVAKVIAQGGAAGLLLGALVQVLYVLGIVTNTLQPVLLGVAFLLVGGWLVALLGIVVLLTYVAFPLWGIILGRRWIRLMPE
jgi:hypothetical protein